MVKRFHQVVGFDFNETFSLIIKPITLKNFVTLDLSKG